MAARSLALQKPQASLQCRCVAASMLSTLELPMHTLHPALQSGRPAAADEPLRLIAAALVCLVYPALYCLPSGSSALEFMSTSNAAGPIQSPPGSHSVNLWGRRWVRRWSEHEEKKEGNLES